jgi:hypothetical protein
VLFCAAIEGINPKAITKLQMINAREFLNLDDLSISISLRSCFIPKPAIG